jgi:hypothetical protein
MSDRAKYGYGQPRPRGAGLVHSRGPAAAPLPRPWEGNITEPWCEKCSWAWKDGVMMIKFINRLCHVHGRQASSETGS